MKFTLKTLLMVPFVSLFVAGSALAVPVNGLENGSFETGDYTGWTVGKGTVATGLGTWSIEENLVEVVKSTTSAKVLKHCFAENMDIEQYSACLPITYQATDGKYVAIQLSNGPEAFQMSQAVTMPAYATFLAWDMMYKNALGSWEPNHYIEVKIIDVLTGAVTSLYKTVGDTPETPVAELSPMTNFRADISQFAGKDVQIVVDLVLEVNYCATAFDNFIVEVEEPVVIEEETLPPVKIHPGWLKKTRRKWNGKVSPGLQKYMDKHDGQLPPGLSEKIAEKRAQRKIRKEKRKAEKQSRKDKKKAEKDEKKAEKRESYLEKMMNKIKKYMNK